MKMTSLIGNDPRTSLGGSKGYTFLELMTAVAILSIGIVGIYQALLTSLDRQSQLSCRLYANNLIEHRISDVQKQYWMTGEIPADDGRAEDVVLDNRRVPFRFTLQTVSAGGLDGLLGAEATLSWTIRDREFNIKRFIFLTDLNMARYPDEPQT